MVLGQLSHDAQATPPRAPYNRPVHTRLTLLGAGTLLITVAAWINLLAQDAENAGQAIVAAVLFLSGAALLMWSTTPGRIFISFHLPLRWAHLCRAAVWTLIGLSACVTIITATMLVADKIATTQAYNSDAAAFNHYNAELVLHGQNPYSADEHFWDALQRFPSVGATPLQAGRYAGRTDGPSLTQLVADVQEEIANPAARGREYSPASLHSYPALAFLVYLPGVWLGLPNTMLTSLLFLVAFFLAVAWGAPTAVRIPITLLLLANTFLVTGTLRGSFEVIALLPLVLAWRALDRRWPSALLVGLGCAVKQIVWPLAILYTVIVWRRYGRREALIRSGITLAAFITPNLPFIITAPGEWARSLFLPVTLPIFPSGVGLGGLARAHVLPILPPPLYAVLEVLTLGSIIWWFARAQHPPRPRIALLLGLLPFFFAWHSALTYFLAMPALAILATLDVMDQNAPAAHASANVWPSQSAPIAPGG